MTRDEYNILREHGDRLLAIEKSLLELPDIIGKKVTAAVKECREEAEVHREKVDCLWAEHQHGEGARGLLSNLGRTAAVTIGVVGTIVGILGAILALT
jgi:hypothetical protein